MDYTPCKYSEFEPEYLTQSGQKTLRSKHRIKIGGLICYGNCSLGAKPCDENCQPEADEHWGNLRCIGCGFETPLDHYDPTTCEYKHAAFSGIEAICKGPMEFRKWPEAEAIEARKST